MQLFDLHLKNLILGPQRALWTMLPATQFNEFIIYVLVARILVAGKNRSHPSILIVAHFDKGSVALLHSLIVGLEYPYNKWVLLLC